MNIPSASLNLANIISASSSSVTKSTARLASGSRILSAADDPAGLVTSVKLNTKASGAMVAARNASDTVSALYVADDGLSSATNILSRMRDLTLAYAGHDAAAQADDTAEFDALAAQLDALNTNTTYGGQQMLAGAFNKTVVTDANGGTTTVDLSSAVIDSSTLNVAAGSLGSITVSDIDTALDTVNAARGLVGAAASSLSMVASARSSEAAALTDAYNAVTTVDYASEMVKMTSANIRQQAATAMLAQANTNAYSVLSLMR